LAGKNVKPENSGTVMKHLDNTNKTSIPRDVETERYVIGSYLRDPGNLALVVRSLNPDDFLSSINRDIFAATQSLCKKKAPVDPLTLYDELMAHGKHILRSTIMEIEDSFIDGLNLSYHIQHLKDFSKLRKLQAVLELTKDPSIEPSDIMKKIDQIRRNIDNTMRLHLITPEDVYNFDKMTPVVKGFIYQDMVHLFSGYSGKGKSVVTIEIAVSIMTGKPVFGRLPVVRPGPVLLVDEETSRSLLRNRFEKMGIGKDLPYYILLFQGIKVDQHRFVEAIIRKIHEIRPALVVFDSLSRVHDQDENSLAMSRPMAAFRKIANEGVAVWLIHHFGKGSGPHDQRSRGHTEIVAAVDIEFSLTAKDNILSLSSVKTRVKEFGPIQVKLETGGDRIKVVYRGTERETLIEQIKDVLRHQNRLTAPKIHEALRERKIEAGFNKVRNILKSSDNGIMKEKEKAGKVYREIYFLNEVESAPSAALYALPPNKGGVGVKSAEATVNGQSEKQEEVWNALAVDDQQIADASQVVNHIQSKTINREVYASRAGS
jgi:hypothetical protein